MSKEAMCIQNSQITKNRKEFVQSMMSLSKLKKADEYCVYYLTHAYNIDPNRKLYFKAPYNYETINSICAYIQFECSEFDMSYTIDEAEVIEILENYYDCSSSFSAEKEDIKKVKGIDLYINWESHCGSNVQSVNCLRRDGMEKYFKEYIEKSNSNAE
ncbi:hypothetical protein [Paenibacillus medicaginis]|uniref:Uncharacterized protein n=1 Tax=Paenibacillus medicaginis TaxID=1470560 RepID=A0ABV5BUJ8_9BACL